MGEELFAKAVRAGLRRVMVGVESGSPGDARSARQGHAHRAGPQTAAMCARHDVGVIFNFIVGFPGEPDESIDATLSLAKRLRACTRVSRRPSSIPALSRNPLAEHARADGYGFPQGLEAWADFDYVGGRAMGQRDAVAPGRALQVLHAPRLAAGCTWRWPLRAAARFRCERDWYDFPVEKALVELVRPPQQVS